MNLYLVNNHFDFKNKITPFQTQIHSFSSFWLFAFGICLFFNSLYF